MRRQGQNCETTRTLSRAMDLWKFRQAGTGVKTMDNEPPLPTAFIPFLHKGHQMDRPLI